MRPDSDDVWLSFCHNDDEEKQIRTRIRRGGERERARAERRRRAVAKSDWDVEEAQKQVTKRSSWLIVSKASKILERSCSPVPRWKDCGVEVMRRERGVER